MSPRFSTSGPDFAAIWPGVRPSSARPPLHPAEMALVVLTGVHLCFLPWALGTMHPWSQWTSLGFATVGFLLALLPRRHGPGTARHSGFRRLIRFPVFWAGAALLGYIAVQGANPAWSFHSNATSWWLEPIAHVNGLPVGVQGPFDRASPWRSLVIDGSLWLLVCSIWAGCHRRQSYRILFGLVVINAFLLAVFGVMEQLTLTQRMFWEFKVSSDSFISSFIYRNHAGAYFNLMVALASGLSWWHYRRHRHGLESPALAVAFAFTAALLAVMVIFSYSRMSILLLLAFAGLLTVSLTFSLLGGRAASRSRRDFLPVLLAFAGFLCVCVVTYESKEVWKRFADIVHDPQASVQNRTLARAAAEDMLRDHWLLGWGAGCFRYGFPLYAQHYPEIYLSPTHGHFYWEHVHNDWLEFPIELGVVGLLPVLAIAVFVVFQAVRQRVWHNPLPLCVLIGCALVFVHAGVDFVLQSPAVLLTLSAFIFAALRWSELDQSEIRRVLPAA